MINRPASMAALARVTPVAGAARCQVCDTLQPDCYRISCRFMRMFKRRVSICGGCLDVVEILREKEMLNGDG